MSSQNLSNDKAQHPFTKGAARRKFTEDEIRQKAKDFVEKHFPKWEKYCEVCNARNCKNNDTCIVCGCQF